MTALEALKAAIDKIQQVSQSVEIETESVSTQNSTSMFWESSVATYAVKLIVSELDQLRSILGILSAGKKLSVTLKRARYKAPTPTVDIGVQFKSKQKVSATCTVEFLVSPKA